MDPVELQALGRYDPAAPGADDWRALLDLALEHGATIDEIVDTARHVGPQQTRRLGLRAVAGFDDPVEVYALTR
jgi:hypothetical protein